MSIVLQNLVKCYGKLSVVNDICLELRDGELFVLLGGSGSGKSTLLRLIAGLAEPDSGRIVIHGRDVTRLPPQLRGTGFVFQNYSIFRHMSVFQNIEFGLKLRKVSPQECRRRCEELLELVGLAGLGHRFSHQLSGGQQQRVALARALAYNPGVLLLDEPFGALDAQIRGQLRRSLREVQQRLKVTTILVTHDQDEAFELADRIGVIERGRLVEVGTPEDLYHRPVSQFVSTFIGGGNLLVGSFRQRKIQLGSATLPRPEGAPAFLEGVPVRVLIRPEHLTMQQEAFAEDGPVWSLGQGEILQRTFAGSVERVRVRLESLRGVRVISPIPEFGDSGVTLEASLASTLRLAPGSRVWVGVTHYHLLERIGLKSLILLEPEGPIEVAEVGCRLAERVGAPATLFAVGSEESLQPLVQRWRNSLPGLSLKVCPAGPSQFAQQALREVQDGAHELVVVASPATPLGSELLQMSLLPVLFGRGLRPTLERILICTEGGEPGKADIWMGGRIARRAGAAVTVLHVSAPTGSPESRQRAERHLLQASNSLETMAIVVTTRLVESADRLGAIQEELASGSYDMLVLGAPDKPLGRAGLAQRVLEEVNLPVLIVPMLEA